MALGVIWGSDCACEYSLVLLPGRSKTGRCVCMCCMGAVQLSGSCAPEGNAEYRDVSYVSIPPSHPVPHSVAPCLLALKETGFGHIKKHILLLT